MYSENFSMSTAVFFIGGVKEAGIAAFLDGDIVLKC